MAFLSLYVTLTLEDSQAWNLLTELAFYCPPVNTGFCNRRVTL
jgi:hypothetical protein